MRIPAPIADEAHHIVDLVRGSLSGDPFDPTATQAYGQIIEAIREPGGPHLPGDPEIKFGVGLGRHIAAEASLVHASAQIIAADRHITMEQALRVLDAALDDMAAGRPVSSRERARRQEAPRHRSPRDCGVPAFGRGRGPRRFMSGDRRIHHAGRT
jgi:hypothetical protein